MSGWPPAEHPAAARSHGQLRRLPRAERAVADIEEGELRCIIGPNGAGKTTMMDVITGKTRPTRGKVMFDQNIDVRRMSEPEIAHLGIGRKFQKPTIFENLTVFENLELSMKTDKRARTSLLRLARRRCATRFPTPCA
jgi:ABC-type uncharacterized transport system ATPase subunit